MTFSLFESGRAEEAPPFVPGEREENLTKVTQICFSFYFSFFFQAAWWFPFSAACERVEAPEVAAANCVCFWLPFHGERAGERRGCSRFGNKRDGPSGCRGSSFPSLHHFASLTKRFPPVKPTASVAGRPAGMRANMTNFAILHLKL